MNKLIIFLLLFFLNFIIWVMLFCTWHLHVFYQLQFIELEQLQIAIDILQSKVELFRTQGLLEEAVSSRVRTTDFLVAIFCVGIFMLGVWAMVNLNYNSPANLFAVDNYIPDYSLTEQWDWLIKK